MEDVAEDAGDRWSGGREARGGRDELSSWGDFAASDGPGKKKNRIKYALFSIIQLYNDILRSDGRFIHAGEMEKR